MSNLSHIVERLSAKAQRALIKAQQLSADLRHEHTGTEHLLFGIVAEKNTLGGEILAKHKITEKKLKDLINQKNQQLVTDNWSTRVSTNFRHALEKSAIIASTHNSPYIATEHILFGIIDTEESKGREILETFEVNLAQLRKQLYLIIENSAKFTDFLEEGAKSLPLTENDIKSAQGPGAKIAKSPALDYFTTDLNEKARQDKIDPVIGRSDEIDRLISILNRRTKNNPVLIGEPGVGKTAIVEGLALAISQDEVPESLKNKKILALDLALVVAGSMFRGEFENRLKQVIDEVNDDPDIILFIDELHTLVGAGATTGSLDAANILKPALARGSLRAIGATTLSEYKKYIETDAALERRFQPILVEEPSLEESCEIISGIKDNYEKHHGLIINDEAIKVAVELSARYIQDRYLPDKAIDLIDESAASLRTKNERSPKMKKLRELESRIKTLSTEKNKAVLTQDFATAQELKEKEEKLRSEQESYEKKVYATNKELKNEINSTDIAATLSRITKIPLQNLVEAEMKKLGKLEKTLKKNIIGQNEILETIAHTIKRARLKISSPQRPLGSFIFLGPSGVGKTETAKILAKQVFQSKNALIRVDMSEFMERHNVSRLVGAPAGYVGYEEGGRLTEAVRRQPYAIILFDEIEKAHPDVFNLLLQILEEGELTDAGGKVVNFRNTIIIMTSNVGLSELNREAANLGFVSEDKLAEAQNSFEETKKTLIESLREFIKPELLNRIDKVLVFKPLDRKDIAKIAKTQLKELCERLSKDEIEVTWTANVPKLIAEKSFDPEQGARLVRKNIQEMIENQIAGHMLNQALVSGENHKVELITKGKEIVIKQPVKEKVV